MSASSFIAYVIGFSFTWLILSYIVPWFDNHQKCDICGKRSEYTRGMYFNDHLVVKCCPYCKEEGHERVRIYSIEQQKRYEMRDMYNNPNKHTYRYYTTSGNYPDWMTEEDKYKLKRLQWMTEEQRQQVIRSQSRDVNIRTCRF